MLNEVIWTVWLSGQNPKSVKRDESYLSTVPYYCNEWCCQVS